MRNPAFTLLSLRPWDPNTRGEGHRQRETNGDQETLNPQPSTKGHSLKGGKALEPGPKATGVKEHKAPTPDPAAKPKRHALPSR